MSKLLSLLLISGTLLVAGCSPPTVFGLPIPIGIDAFGDFVNDFAANDQKVSTPIPEGVYTGTIEVRFTFRLGEDEAMTTASIPFTRGFGSDGEPLNADGSQLRLSFGPGPIENGGVLGIAATENGAIIRVQILIPFIHPMSDPFDLPSIREETYALNQDGTLDLVVVFSGETSEGFAEISSTSTTTLSRD